MANFVEIIKQTAIEAVDAKNPVAVMFGTVKSISPLEINVEQKLSLTEEFLILTNVVKDHEVMMTVEHETEESVGLNANHTHKAANTVEASATQGETKIDVKVDVKTKIEKTNIDLTHTHEYKGTKTFVIHNGLQVGEMVVLLRVQGGQKYVVLGKVAI